jgi:hypothetical protein
VIRVRACRQAAIGLRALSRPSAGTPRAGTPRTAVPRTPTPVSGPSVYGPSARGRSAYGLCAFDDSARASSRSAGPHPGWGDPRTLRAPNRMKHCAVWPRWLARCCVLGRARILRIRTLPASLPRHHPSHPAGRVFFPLDALSRRIGTESAWDRHVRAGTATAVCRLTHARHAEAGARGGP